MDQWKVSALPVLEGEGRVVGVVSEADLLPKEEFRSVEPRPDEFAEAAKAGAVRAGELMSSPAMTVHADATLAEAARIMARRKVKRLPVVNEIGLLEGVVSRSDLLKVFLRKDDEIEAEIRRTVLGGPTALVELDVAVVEGVATLRGSLPDRSLVPLLALNCLSGLDDIDGGRVEIDGRDLFAMSDATRTEHRARTMGFVFQSFNLIPVFSAVENVEPPLLLVGTHPREARSRALAMLDRVGLAHRVEHRPSELSGGEQQRVTIARALAGRPAIVWADEPTGNLDSAMADQVMDLLYGLNREEGQTIVLVTHDSAIGARVPRLIRMHDGRLVDDLRQRVPLTGPASDMSRD